MNDIKRLCHHPRVEGFVLGTMLWPLAVTLTYMLRSCS